MKLYRVYVYYADCEWSEETTLGIFDSEGLAESCRDKYIETVEKLKNRPNPLTEKEQEINVVDLPDDRYEKYNDWQTLINKLNYFSHVNIEVFTLNKCINMDPKRV